MTKLIIIFLLSSFTVAFGGIRHFGSEIDQYDLINSPPNIITWIKRYYKTSKDDEYSFSDLTNVCKEFSASLKKRIIDRRTKIESLLEQKLKEEHIVSRDYRIPSRIVERTSDEFDKGLQKDMIASFTRNEKIIDSYLSLCETLELSYNSETQIDDPINVVKIKFIDIIKDFFQEWQNKRVDKSIGARGTQRDKVVEFKPQNRQNQLESFNALMRSILHSFTDLEVEEMTNLSTGEKLMRKCLEESLKYCVSLKLIRDLNLCQNSWNILRQQCLAIVESQLGSECEKLKKTFDIDEHDKLLVANLKQKTRI